MNRLVLCAYALDLAIGDPQRLPHPVRTIGATIVTGERIVRSVFAATPRGERVGGAVLTAAIVGGTAALAVLTLRSARAIGHRAEAAAAVVTAASAIATRDLLCEALAVLAALRADDLASARTRVARIVGRDTEALDASGVARATIETLAESTCDGVVAPLFFLAVGGAPAALAFKAVSTLDSMIGHRDAVYRHFGTAAARLDDVANLLPARFTALTLACAAPLVGASLCGAMRAVWHDARTHVSPNAGFPEAAIAGALGVRLGGPLSYDGVLVDAPLLHAEGRPPCTADVERAIVLCGVVTLLAAVTLATVTGRA